MRNKKLSKVNKNKSFAEASLVNIKKSQFQNFLKAMVPLAVATNLSIAPVGDGLNALVDILTVAFISISISLAAFTFNVRDVIFFQVIVNQQCYEEKLEEKNKNSDDSKEWLHSIKF